MHKALNVLKISKISIFVNVFLIEIMVFLSLEI